MKKLILLVLIFFMGSIQINAQDELTSGELNFWIANNGSGATVEIEMELVSSTCWDASIYYPDTHNLTDLFGGGSISTNSTGLYLEFLACWETTVPNYYRTFGLGYYKFTGKVNGIVKDYFYIDYRTSDLPENFNFNPNGMGDINITFNISDGKFYYYSTQTLFPANTSIWEEKEWIEHITTELELYLTVSNQNNNPYLEWNEYHDPNILGYNIYRKITWGAGGSHTNVIFTTSTSYLDINFYIPPPKEPGNDLAEYWIRAKISPTEESLEGNHVQAGGTSILQWKISDKERTDDLTYSLNQNYPNPFNPRTTIAFSLKENSLVTLKVFDILGREVAVLVNGVLTAGNHQVQFDGNRLESGVYFYEIRAGNFRDVKKLILTK
jgi:hypothetical protein